MALGLTLGLTLGVVLCAPPAHSSVSGTVRLVGGATGGVAPPAIAAPTAGTSGVATASGTPTSWSGTTVATLLPNYNASLAGNFRSLVDDWEVGAPAVVPFTGTAWFPQVPVSIGGSPAPVSAPALLYNLSKERFVGIDTSVTNISALAYDPATRMLYGTDPINDSIEPINATTGLPNGTAYHVGDDPSAIAYDPTTGYLFVANAGSNSVTVIDPISHTIPWASVAVGADPRLLEDDSQDGWMYVGDWGSSYLSRLDVSLPTTAETPTLLFHGAARGLAFSERFDNLAVTTQNGSNLTIVSGSTGAVLTTTVTIGPGLAGVSAAGNGSTFVVANSTGDSLALVNASTFAVSAKLLWVGPHPTSLVSVSSDGPVLVWNNGTRNVSVVAASLSGVQNGTTTLAPSPVLMAYSAPLQRLFVGDVELPGVEVLNPFNGASESAPIVLPSPPLSLDLTPSGSTLYVAISSEVEAFNASTDAPVAQDTRLSGANGPIAIDPASNLLWVGRPTAGDIVALNATSLVASGPVANVRVTTGSPGSLIFASGPRSMFAINSTSGDVAEFNGSTGAPIGSPDSAGTNLTALAWDPVDGLVYAAGSGLSAVDPTTLAVDLSSFPLAPHNYVGGIAYEPSREAIYVSTWTSSPYSGSLSVINGSSVAAAAAGISVVPTGFEPTSLVLVEGPTGSLPDSGTVLVSNNESGTISVVASPPEILSAAFDPARVDASVPTELVVAAAGGATTSSLAFPDGLPPGCPSSSGFTVTCVPTESGRFEVIVTVTDALGESASATADLTVASGLTVGSTVGVLASHEVDVGIPVAMSALASGGTPGYAYAWSFGDGGSGSGVSVSHTFETTGEVLVTVTVTDEGGGRAVNETLVAVEADPAAQIAVAPATTTDVNVSLALTATVTGGAGSGAGLWDFGDGTTSSSFRAAHAWQKPGVYVVNYTYTDGLDLQAKQTVSILVNPELTGEFSVTPTVSTPIVGTNFDFTANLVGGTPTYTVEWSFGDGSTADGEQVAHAYGAPGQYEVEVEATDAAGAVVNETFRNIDVGTGGSSPAPVLGGGFGPAFALGLVVGGTVAAVALFVAERFRRAGPPGPPSPYVPPPPPPGRGRG